MKWSWLRKTNSPTEELRKQNKLTQKQVVSDFNFFKKSAIFFRRLFAGIKLNVDVRDQVEDLLLSLDFGPFLSDHLSKQIALRFGKKEPSAENLQASIKYELLQFYGDYDYSLNIEKGRTNILLMIGANGSGKTTTIAKLANKFKGYDMRVLVVAGDTFRAGAVDQLKKWAESLGVDIFVPEQEKEDPAALIYKALTNNATNPYDLIICDTSGRQHNNINLMKELNKIYRIIQKFDATAPHETLLVIDSTSGQMSLQQADQFLQHAPVTGIVLSKMDNMTKGGIIFAIKDKFKVPVKFVGVGESPDHLMEFDLCSVIDSWVFSIK